MAVAYAYDGTLYLAVTRRCTLACSFCPKTHGRWTVAGNDMSRDTEPTLERLLAAAHGVLETEPLHKVAFVGLGEPTFRLDLVTAAGRALRREGHHVRLVTDGLANLRAGRDVTPELADALDEVNVSLNAPDGEAWARVCPNPFGPAGHAAVCEFVTAVKRHVPAVVASCVAAPGVDVPATEALANRLGVPLRVRAYFDPRLGEPHEQAPQRERPPAAPGPEASPTASPARAAEPPSPAARATADEDARPPQPGPSRRRALEGEAYSALIVGGGIAGLSTAWALTRAGVTDVCLVEREWACGTQASGTNAAIFRQLDADPLSVALSARSRVLLAHLAPGLLRETGALYLGPEATLERAHGALAAHGVPHQRLDRQTIERTYPVLAPFDPAPGGQPSGSSGPSASWPGLLLPGDGVLDLHGLVEALQRRLRAARASVLTGEGVVGWERDGSEVRVALASGATLRTSRLVLAVGAWSAELGERGGLALPIEPRRRHLALLEPQSGVPRLGPVVWRLEDEVYLRDESGGVLASPCDEVPAEPTPGPVDPEALAHLCSKLSSLAPALATASVRRAWSCLRSFAPDRDFIAGPDPRWPGVSWLAGLGGRGMSCGLALGEVVAAALLERPHALRAPLAPARLLPAR